MPQEKGLKLHQQFWFSLGFFPACTQQGAGKKATNRISDLVFPKAFFQQKKRLF